MEMIGIVLVVGIITFGIYKLFELFARRKERMAMIEKFSEGITPQLPRGNTFDIRILKDLSGGSWSIRIGMLLLGVGLGVTIATIVDLAVSPYDHDRELYYQFRNTLDVLYPACAAVFGGLGLVVAYLIEQKNEKKDKNKSEE